MEQLEDLYTNLNHISSQSHCWIMLKRQGYTSCLRLQEMSVGIEVETSLDI